MTHIRPFAHPGRVLGTALFILLLLGPGTGPATADDQIGLYFDSDYTTNEVQVTEAGTFLTAYLVLLQPSAPEGIAAWELRLADDHYGAITYLGWELEGQALNILSPPQFVVGLGTPLPSSEAVLLATGQLMVNEVVPVTFSLLPIWQPSIPGEMVYLSGATPGELIPMQSVTGFDEAAWINRDQPVGVATPSTLSYGEVALGQSLTRELEISNIGSGDLFLDINISAGCEGFAIEATRYPEVVAPGSSIILPVTFTPTHLGLHECVLELGSEHIDDVPLFGIGREPLISWALQGSTDFGEVVVGIPTILVLGIFNDGEAPFEMAPSLPGSCDGFTILNPDPVVVPVGELRSLHVLFLAPAPGPHVCTLDLGNDLGTLELTATARDPELAFQIYPANLVFPQLLLPVDHTETVQLHNTGEVPLPVDAELLDGGVGFSIAEGGEPIVVEPGAYLAVVVRLVTDQEGNYLDTLTFNHPDLPDVPIRAEVVQPNPSCLVTPEVLDFGEIPLGQSAVRYVTVRNTGNVPLQVEAASTCTSLLIFPQSAELPPGYSQQFTLNYQAQYVGPFECLVTFGESLCSPVACYGEVVSGPGPDENLVGLYFDPDFTQMETILQFPGQVLPTYLVLTNPSADNGVLGWECRLAFSSNLVFLLSADLMGDALNVTTPPEFTVGLGTPLPWAQAVHLATLDLLVLEYMNDVFLELHPTWQPSIPGEMAYLGGGPDPELLPMYPVTGMPVVALITVGIVAVDTPAPQLSLDGGAVSLTWSVHEPVDAGYVVYRREGTDQAQALNDEPLQASGGEVSFVDRPAGFAPGTTLHYSYAVVREGVEIRRSPETEIRLTGLPALTTRLQPNVPNPFNPRTEVRFALGEAAHARVSVYDLSGRLVRVLVDEDRGPGEHAVLWQGRDRHGRQVPSGAYYLRLETGGRVDQRKIMLLK